MNPNIEYLLAPSLILSSVAFMALRRTPIDWGLFWYGMVSLHRLEIIKDRGCVSEIGFVIMVIGS